MRRGLPSNDFLLNLLDETDDFATKNVQNGGGPFGASLHIYEVDRRLHSVGGPVANAVVQTGIATAHAEDRALGPNQMEALKRVLWRMRGRDISVILSSSGESCAACHSKEEIAARDLESENLIEPGRFFVTYGATYEAARVVAGFNDEPYHHDMQKNPGTGLIKQVVEDIAAVPRAVAEIFSGFRQPLAVVALADGTHYMGSDNRTRHDLTATPEVSAIRAACADQKRQGKKEPWNLGDAFLYTATRDIGPLAYATAQWANVTHWQTVTGLPEGCRETRETQGITNRELFRHVAERPYNQPGSAIQVVRLEPFANRAQQAWGARQTKAMYNGAG